MNDNKIIQQYRFFNYNSKENYGFSNEDIKNQQELNNIMLLSDKKIYQIGIQSLPGTKIYFNNSEQAIIIGNNGYFEISANSNVLISQISIAKTSLDLIDQNPAAILIIDTIEGKD